MTNYREEFKDEVERQLVHMTIKRDYLQHRIDTDLRDESSQNRAKAKVELDALNVKLSDLEKMKAWLNQK
jgi:hypothetical protein